MEEITAVSKKLRDGRALVITVRAAAGSITGWEMRAEIAGQAVADGFTACVERGASPVRGLPHVIRIPLASGPAPVGLTRAEADGIDAAVRGMAYRIAAARPRPVRATERQVRYALDLCEQTGNLFRPNEEQFRDMTPRAISEWITDALEEI